MNEDECRVADWRAIGYEDGVSGVAASHIGERREACAEHGVAPNFTAYIQGRDEGLREFCTPISFGTAKNLLPSSILLCTDS